MTGQKKPSSSSAKAKLPEVPALVFDNKNNKRFRKGEFLGKVSQHDDHGSWTA